MSDGQVKKYSAKLYFLECPAVFGNRTSKNLGVLVRRTNDHFKIFLPLITDIWNNASNEQNLTEITRTQELHVCAEQSDTYDI